MQKDEIVEENAEPVWLQEDFELTWPIWHMLPYGDRKALANKYGYKTIGDFEEYMTLRRAVDETIDEQQPYQNEQIYGIAGDCVTNHDASRDDAKSSTDEDDDDEDEEEDAIENEKTLLDEESLRNKEELEDMTAEELIDSGGLILTLPEDLAHHLFSFLPVYMFARLALVTPYWKHFARTEYVYKKLCERCYLQAAKRKVLNVSRFGGSYRSMLMGRPRVRTAGGLYVLKYAQVKKIQRDMWTEIPFGSILETVYYRYISFNENGTLVYALTTTRPHEMIPRLIKMKVTGEPDRSAVMGHYQMQKNSVVVIATQEWHTVKMEFTIQNQSIWGRYGGLTFDRHLSSRSGDFDEYWSRDIVEYKVPYENSFRFLRDRRL
uniref:F-box domain-containing protein n=1 Tax=Grammatophora oceanica TaxID=210454 RepID=A0A6U5L561_9STRA|mmetsp:Transcript_31744/g.47167  ORF Transcript_31744/g.47167 Transcript_31744/m.47167 type:complete len:378 (+) Transcript_31744:55-1188(+)